MKKVKITLIAECTEKGYRDEVYELKKQIESGEFQRGMITKEIPRVKATFEIL